MTDLSVIEIKNDQCPVLYAPGGLDSFLEQIREAVNEVPDLSTKKGRDRVKSLAAQVSRSKTAIEKPGRDYLRRLKEAVKPAEAELKRFVDACDALRDEVRRPLTEFEEAEKARVSALNERLTSLRAAGDVIDQFGNLAETQQIRDRLTQIKSVELDDSWQEVTAEAGVAKDAAIKKLEAALAQAEKRDAEAAELERLRKEAEQKAQRDREEQIRKEAEEKARIEAESRARLEIEAAARREAEEKARAEAAERHRIESEQRAQREKEEALKLAEAEKQAAIDAERRKQQEAEAERIAEQKRIADEETARAADVEHRRAINRKAVADLVASGVSEEMAEKAIKAIVTGKVSGVSIKY